MISVNSNQSIIVFCPKAGPSQQTQHSLLYPLLSVPFDICMQSIYHDVVYHLISYSAANLLLVNHSFQSILQPGSSFLASGPANFFPLLYQFQHYSSFFHSLQQNTIFILSHHFTRSILLHTHISNASSSFCSFRLCIIELYTPHKSLHQPLPFPRVRRKCFSS